MRSTIGADGRYGRARGAFTLFEVSISMVLVSFGVISVLMLFPQGIKAEQMARMRVIAAVKAQEIIDSFATSANANPSTETEAPLPWDVAAGYRVWAPDLESRINTHRYGIMPVPLEIARRLDSEGNEIGNILAEGGQLFYSQASGATGLEETVVEKVTKQPDPLTQRLVFAVVGYAQSNHLAFLPQKAWPYYAGYPSPPGHGETKARNPQPTDSLIFGYDGGNPIRVALWEGVGSGNPDDDERGTTDKDIAKVFAWPKPTPAPAWPKNLNDGDVKHLLTMPVPTESDFGYKQYGLSGFNNKATIAGADAFFKSAVRYLQSALWYCERKKLGQLSMETNADWYAPAEPFTIKTKVTERMGRFRALPDEERWKFVQAFRFLAHASACITRHKTLTELGGQPSASTGLSIASATIDGSASPELMLTHDKIVYYHELCMEMAMLYAASQPYDWGAPRPTQRALFTDHPLIEYDLFSPRQVGKITNTNKDAQQWRPVAGRKITTIGRSYEFPASPIPESLWGDPGRFTLTREFKAEERCRQLVFWSVDWQSYEDFETAPSGPIDASKYQFAAPVGNANLNNMDERMNGSTWPDHHIYQYRNPEKTIAFLGSVTGMATGRDLTTAWGGGDIRILNRDGGGVDQGNGLDQRRRFLGRWGADRNFNGILDRGTLPGSIRLRVAEVSRFNFYDPRLTLKLR